MNRVIRPGDAGLSPDEARQQPLYARMLRLRYLAPGGFLCFVFLEGAVALGILLALAELVSWWGVLVLPIMVAVMVKLNDVVAGILARPAVVPPAVRTTPAVPGEDLSLARARTVDLRGSVVLPEVASMNGPEASPGWAGQLDARQQWVRQSAMRRYE
jgi:hypothetical protein